MEKTIREIVNEKLNNLWKNFETLTPEELSQILCELSALLGNIGNAIIEKEQLFIQKQLKIWEENEMSAKEMEIRSKVLPEYKEFMETKVLEKTTIEVVRSIKVRLRIIQNEQWGSKNL